MILPLFIFIGIGALQSIGLAADEPLYFEDQEGNYSVYVKPRDRNDLFGRTLYAAGVKEGNSTKYVEFDGQGGQVGGFRFEDPRLQQGKGTAIFEGETLVVSCDGKTRRFFKKREGLDLVQKTGIQRRRKNITVIALAKDSNSGEYLYIDNAGLEIKKNGRDQNMDRLRVLMGQPGQLREIALSSGSIMRDGGSLRIELKDGRRISLPVGKRNEWKILSTNGETLLEALNRQDMELLREAGVDISTITPEPITCTPCDWYVREQEAKSVNPPGSPAAGENVTDSNQGKDVDTTRDETQKQDDKDLKKEVPR